MAYRDNLDAALAQNDVLASELKKAQERIEKTGPQEIPNLDDVVLEMLMGWKKRVEWPRNGWTVLVTDNDTPDKEPLYGIAFVPKRKCVEINTVKFRYNFWEKYHKIYVVEKGKAKILKQALVYKYLKIMGGRGK